MNTLAIVFVNDHLESLRRDGRKHRSAALVERRTLRARIGSAASGLGRMLGSGSGPVIPQLKDYPYGG